ncbi:sigma-54 interaction domain-containing protein [Treponema pectinovorum]|uniref:sigma-54 interaction domain-containing protein n=1 Tax=Treponema pectinovorum TaxID=164 RepID=UPI0011CA3B0E|nr:sigma 54-interacting transcriptional regulator [Treponema pectinovorum]
MSDMNSLSLEKLKTLIEINDRINSNYSDINALLVYILESAMRLVECEASSILLVNKEDETLRFMVALGPKGVEAKNILVEKNSIAGWVVENNKYLIVNNAAKDPRFSKTVQDKTGYITKTMIAIPMKVKGKCIGVIELINKLDGRLFDKADLEILELLSNQAGIAYSNADSFRAAQDKISILQSNIENGIDYHSFVAKSSSVLDLLHVIDEVARANTTILITGESGVGKELFAEQIHLRSNRSDKPFIRVNCAALSPSLLESELFGHVKGAFTDAVTDRKGRFEAADKGTLFLDEIGELPIELQSKLLRVLQSRTFERVGSSDSITVDVRIVVATNRNLEKMVNDGSFRADLYYRLNVMPLNIPPLRERKEDILPLAKFFLSKFGIETKKSFEGFSSAAERILLEYYWPGNVRELENSIERACVLGIPPLIQGEDLRINYLSAQNPPKDKDEIGNSYSIIAEEFANPADGDRSLKTAITKFKTAYVKQILNETSWNQTEAGKILGIQRTYVSRLLNELNIR